LQIKMQKKILRRHVLSIRRSLSKEQIKSKSEKIREKLFNLPIFKEAEVILFYLSLPDEVQTYEMVKDSLRIGKRVAVPVVNLEEKEIIPFELKNSKFKLIPGPFGILQPDKDDCYPLLKEDIDLVIVPGIAFDSRGGRIGFGKGFYDRFLSTLSDVGSVALAFECQVFDKVPCDRHDVKVNFIITEKRVIRCYNIVGEKNVP